MQFSVNNIKKKMQLRFQQNLFYFRFIFISGRLAGRSKSKNYIKSLLPSPLTPNSININDLHHVVCTVPTNQSTFPVAFSLLIEFGRRPKFVATINDNLIAPTVHMYKREREEAL